MQLWIFRTNISCTYRIFFRDCSRFVWRSRSDFFFSILESSEFSFEATLLMRSFVFAISLITLPIASRIAVSTFRKNQRHKLNKALSVGFLGTSESTSMYLERLLIFFVKTHSQIFWSYLVPELFPMVEQPGFVSVLVALVLGPADHIGQHQ